LRHTLATVLLAICFVTSATGLATADKKAAASKKSKLTRDQVDAASDQQDFFDEVKATVTTKLGSPKTTTGTIKEWYFDTAPLSKTFSCSTIALIPTPQGHGVVSTSVYTGPACKGVKLTRKQVEVARAGASRAFADMQTLFDKTLGKPVSTRPAQSILSWEYQDEETCYYLTLFKGTTGIGEFVTETACK
jgi:hypothetical protein